MSAEDTSVNNMFECMTTFGNFDENGLEALAFSSWVALNEIDESNQDALA